MEDICRAAKRLVKYSPPLTDTEVNNCFSIGLGCGNKQKNDQILEFRNKNLYIPQKWIVLLARACRDGKAGVASVEVIIQF